MEDQSETSSPSAWERPCPHCGADIQRVARRCPFCGHDIAAEDEPQLRPMEVDPEGVREVSIALIVVFVFLVPIALAVWAYTSIFW